MAGNQSWRTPPWLFNLIEKEIVKRKFKLDAAATKENAMCRKFCTKEQNGLSQPWVDATFVNPGFAEFGYWMAQAVRNARADNLVVALIGPKGCSQLWFHQYSKQSTIYAPDARINFIDPETGEQTTSAREDSMLYVVGPGFWNNSKTDFKVKALNVRR